MKDQNDEELPVHPLLYMKRPDLRLNELRDGADLEELSSWKWWITTMELYKGELQEQPILESINALDLPLYQHIHGTPDPVKIIAFFCLCHERGVYPPAWIMNELYTRFEEYMKDNSSGEKKRRLGEYFGEPARGDRSPFFRQQAFKEVMESALIAVDRLRFCFGLSKEQALGIVSLRLESVVNTTSFRFNKGEAALEKAYREWSKKVHCHDWLERFKNRTFTDKENLEFLRSFPPDSFTGFPQIEKLLQE